jgi:hypothetical protein
MAVTDAHLGESLTFEIDHAAGLGAFHHPCEYAGDRRRLMSSRRDLQLGVRRRT